MLAIVVTAATLPGNGGIVCRLEQLENMLAMFVTAVALGKLGNDCKLRQPLKRLAIEVSAPTATMLMRSINA